MKELALLLNKIKEISDKENINIKIVVNKEETILNTEDRNE